MHAVSRLSLLIVPVEWQMVTMTAMVNDLKIVSCNGNLTALYEVINDSQ